MWGATLCMHRYIGFWNSRWVETSVFWVVRMRMHQKIGSHVSSSVCMTLSVENVAWGHRRSESSLELVVVDIFWMMCMISSSHSTAISHERVCWSCDSKQKKSVFFDDA